MLATLGVGGSRPRVTTNRFPIIPSASMNTFAGERHGSLCYSDDDGIRMNVDLSTRRLTRYGFLRARRATTPLLDRFGQD
jgi:hypothetical protein